MKKLSARNTVEIITIIIFCDNIIFGLPGGLKQDTWIAFLLSLIFVIPLVFVYSRIIRLSPAEDFFGACEYVFGAFVSKLLNSLMLLYLLYMGSASLRNFTEFISLISLKKTPHMVIAVCIFTGAVYLAVSGTETIAKWVRFTVIAAFVMIGITILLGMPLIDFNNIKPVMEHSKSEIFGTSFKMLGYPFGEMVLILFIFKDIEEKRKVFGMLLMSLVLSVTVILTVFFKTLFILGPNSIEEIYFPIYAAVSIINIGKFFERPEVFLGFFYTIAGITKIAVCIISASKGISSIFKLKNSRSILVPGGIFMLALCSYIFGDFIQMFNFQKVYYLFAMPFQVLIPLLVWIGLEIKANHKASLTRQTKV